MSVMFDWFWAYLTYRSGTRLITGGPAAQLDQGMPAVVDVKAAA